MLSSVMYADTLIKQPPGHASILNSDINALFQASVICAPSFIDRVESTTLSLAWYYM